MARTWLTAAVRLALAVVFCGYLLDYAEQRGGWWPSQWAALEGWWLAAAALLLLPYFYWRSARLAALLQPVECGAHAVPLRLVLGSGGLAFFWTWLLPLRLGELARPLILARAHVQGWSAGAMAGAVLFERLVDALVIAGLALSTFLVVPTSRSDDLLVYAIGTAAVALSALACAGLGLLTPLGQRGVQAVASLAAPASRWRLALLRGDLWLQPARESLARARATGAWRRFCWQSAAYWSVTAWQVWALAQACHLPLSALGAVAVVGLVGLAIQVPAGPGQLGAHQAGVHAALTLVAGDLPAVQVTTFVTLTWLSQVLGHIGAGAIGLWLVRTRLPASS